MWRYDAASVRQTLRRNADSQVPANNATLALRRAHASIHQNSHRLL